MKRTEEKVFTFFLLLIVLGMVAMTFEYRPGARLVPLVVGTGALALMALLSLMTVFPKLDAWYQRLEGSSLTRLMDKTEELEKSKKSLDLSQIRKKEISVIGWLLFLTVATYLLGFLIAIPLFLFLFLKLWAKEGWILSVCMSGTVLGIVFFIFAYILNIPLHEGVIFG